MITSPLEPVPTERVETNWRRIITPIPAPESVPLIERLRSVEPRSMTGMPPILWDQAEGFLVRDGCGNQWIDLTSGIVMANAGHAHPRILAAIRRATEERLLFTYAFPSRSRLALLEKLRDLSPIPDSSPLLFSSGTEATECAMALMRRHGRSLSPDKVGILSFRDGFHGRTLAASLAAGSPGEDDWIEREQVRHYQLPYPFCPRNPWRGGRHEPCDRACFEECLESLEEGGIPPGHIAGIIAEPVPGWATWPMPTGFAAAMAEWARKHDILICFDEVQCGCGRTGRFFGFEHVGITPDLITLGKGLTSSLPVSAVIGTRRLMDGPRPGEMSSTHGGNPVCAAAALTCLQVLEEEQLAAAAARAGEQVLARLRQLEKVAPGRVRSAHGRGLFISVHLQQPHSREPDASLADAVAHEAVRRGVMMFPTGRGFLKFAPPLCIDPVAALEAADVIGDCLADVVDRSA